MLASYVQVFNGKQLFIGNSSTSKVEEQENVILKLTSGKELTLNNMLHVLDIPNNLFFDSLLSKNGFKLVFNLYLIIKFVLSKNDIYFGKSYLSDGLYKLNILTVVPKSTIY